MKRVIVSTFILTILVDSRALDTMLKMQSCCRCCARRTERTGYASMLRAEVYRAHIVECVYTWHITYAVYIVQKIRVHSPR